MRHLTLFPLVAALTLGACAPQLERVASAAAPAAAQPAGEKPVWAFEASDVPVEPGWTFGQLPNGMRYVIRHNATPAETALVRMEVDAGSLDERDDERGFAHFVEHMAFNGSTHVPEGEMVRLLERDGLAFGADTNAQTSFEQTLYMLDLPRNDAALLDTALMLMRETASELSFSPEAVDRERGVVQAEKRDRNSFRMRNLENLLAFAYPGARYVERLPIGTDATLAGATAQGLKEFWQRTYVPGRTTVVVVGDFDPAAVEVAIRARFGDWKPAEPAPRPSAGPVDPASAGRSDVYVDPALAETVTATRHAPWLDEPDSLAQRRENLLRQLGYAIVNRRLQRLALSDDPQFRTATLSTSDVFHAGRSTTLSVSTADGRWQRGLQAAAREYRRALAYGFTQAEVAEQLARVRTAQANAAISAGTRSNSALLNAALDLLTDDVVPTSPQDSLDRLEAFIPEITPEAVLAALKREAVPLDNPLLRFEGRQAPAGGAKALRSAWNEATRARSEAPPKEGDMAFAYTDFGPAGTVVSDNRESGLGIREVRFANGVRLNLKRTSLEQGRIRVKLAVDGGEMLDTRANPLATDMVPSLAQGGLGKHSLDDIQTLAAGHTVGFGLGLDEESFVSSATTTPADLGFQLGLMAALVTDPGYRRVGEVRYWQAVNNFFAARNATPGSALSSSLDGILSDGDPRFTLQDQKAYQALTFARLKEAIADRLAHGAIEIGLVGDFDEDEAIAAVARTLGALPAREANFRSYDDQRERAFTAARNVHLLRHTGAKDQALLRFVWPTRDGEDPEATAALRMLARVVQIELTESLREKLGQAYSPFAQSDASRVWKGYGTFSIGAQVDVSSVAAARAAVVDIVKALRDRPVSDDELLRARAPMLESLDNALKDNGGWMALVERAQGKPDRIARFLAARSRYEAVTPARLQELAQLYLAPEAAVEVDVLPEGVDPPAN